jgi:hypothetical protein
MYVEHLDRKKNFNCRWWQDLYAEVALSYARDRTVQLYLWAHTMCYEKEYSCARVTLTKLSALVTMMDDTYDVRATLEEGRSLNEAIQRWDYSGHINFTSLKKLIN